MEPGRIEFRVGGDLELEEVIDVYRDSGLGERRPAEDRRRMAVMLANADRTRLIERTRRECEPDARLVLLAAPAAVDYYAQLGFERHPSAWTPPRHIATHSRARLRTTPAPMTATKHGGGLCLGADPKSS